MTTRDKHARKAARRGRNRVKLLPRLVFRGSGNPPRPLGLYREDRRIADWPAGYDMTRENASLVEAAWEAGANQADLHVLTRDEVRALLTKIDVG